MERASEIGMSLEEKGAGQRKLLRILRLQETVDQFASQKRCAIHFKVSARFWVEP